MKIQTDRLTETDKLMDKTERLTNRLTETEIDIVRL